MTTASSCPKTIEEKTRSGAVRHTVRANIGEDLPFPGARPRMPAKRHAAAPDIGARPASRPVSGLAPFRHRLPAEEFSTVAF
jgi:hypothetical protein